MGGGSRAASARGFHHSRSGLGARLFRENQSPQGCLRSCGHPSGHPAFKMGSGFSPGWHNQRLAGPRCRRCFAGSRQEAGESGHRSCRHEPANIAGCGRGIWGSWRKRQQPLAQATKLPFLHTGKHGAKPCRLFRTNGSGAKAPLREQGAEGKGFCGANSLLRPRSRTFSSQRGRRRKDGRRRRGQWAIRAHGRGRIRPDRRTPHVGVHRMHDTKSRKGKAVPNLLGKTLPRWPCRGRNGAQCHHQAHRGTQGPCLASSFFPGTGGRTRPGTGRGHRDWPRSCRHRGKKSANSLPRSGTSQASASP